MLSQEAAYTHFLVLGFTYPGLKLIINHLTITTLKQFQMQSRTFVVDFTW
jgi:hypothetical protein